MSAVFTKQIDEWVYVFERDHEGEHQVMKLSATAACDLIEMLRTSTIAALEVSVAHTVNAISSHEAAIDNGRARLLGLRREIDAMNSQTKGASQ